MRCFVFRRGIVLSLSGCKSRFISDIPTRSYFGIFYGSEDGMFRKIA